ncbi:RsmB/NOP family class I SAM-dependent RNA methyltransferase [Planktotalea sp.]|uniref:RsmB/NOP family class I SAM-dependent RNA methyltransferase n=1 Tax=Planktotalea sp. TaxID=2029877 RepID=UPI003D6BDFBB
MTPAARVQAAIECLDDIFAGAPAEKTLTSWARRSRFAGSKDRAAVRDHVFDALRNRDSFAALGGGLSGRAVMIGLATHQNLPLDDLFSGLGYSAAPLSEDEQALVASAEVRLKAEEFDEIWDLPDWCQSKLQASHPETAKEIATALRQRASVDLRVNTRKSSRSDALEELASSGISAEVCQISNSALRVTEGARRVKNSPAYLEGRVELQDAGSQALVDAIPLSGAHRVLDYCAGGGGKALALASRGTAAIFAHDISDARMKDIPIRAKRAGVEITCLNTASLASHGPFDVVLCDAPCSGSGAWRRSPDAKWRITPDRFEELVELQSDVLSNACSLVRPGGLLVYATCSLFAEENEHQVKRFLDHSSQFELNTSHSWSPLDDCDGFYVAIMSS